jgi:hypothetical protein
MSTTTKSVIVRRNATTRIPWPASRKPARHLNTAAAGKLPRRAWRRAYAWTITVVTSEVPLS